ncbi:pilin [Comamonas sp. C11]|nr:pilin [Comamonas sp. C11]
MAKSQVSRVMSEVGALRTAAEACILDGKLTPVASTNTTPAATECNLGSTTSNLLGAATAVKISTGLMANLGDASTDATLEATFGTNAAVALTTTGKNTLTWTRQATTGAWVCSTTVDTKYRPAGCSSSSATFASGT